MNVYLEHHGIKGQKWGVRRYQNKDGTSTALGKRRDRGKNTENNESKAKVVSEKKNTKKYGKEISMSDDDLNYAISRLSRESQYRQLMSDRSKAYTSTSEKFANSLAKSVKTKSTKMGNDFVDYVMSDVGNRIASAAYGKDTKMF